MMRQLIRLQLSISQTVKSWLAARHNGWTQLPTCEERSKTVIFTVSFCLEYSPKECNSIGLYYVGATKKFKTIRVFWWCILKTEYRRSKFLQKFTHRQCAISNMMWIFTITSKGTSHFARQYRFRKHEIVLSNFHLRFWTKPLKVGITECTLWLTQNGRAMAQAVSRRALTAEARVRSLPIPVAARSKAWVCGRSLAGIVGSNPA